MEILASGEKTKQIILARLASDDAFWDDLEKSYGPRPRPVRRDDAEPKTSWTKMDHLATPSQKAQAAAAAWLEDEEEDEDDPEREALRHRKRWNSLWSQYFGSFEDTTIIPPMRYTDEPPVETIFPCRSLQVFSAKIAGIEGGFRWPIDVFGLVAIGDSVDQNRNIIFQRSRVECQTLTEKDPYLVLTGPTRAIVLSDSATIEVYLKVKGPTEHEDETLCFVAEEMLCSIPAHSSMLHRIFTSKFSTLELTLGHIIFSVEATISVRVDDGSWPDGFHRQFSACTNGEAVHPSSGTTSVNDKKIILLSFGDEKVPVIGDGMIELSRRVVSVPVNMKLEVSVKAWQDDSNAVEAVEEFTAKKADRSFGTLDIGYCKMDVIVAWSLISNDPEPR
ncbi:unnamed protein product [Urochloa decumbens]|uniref:DUF6598 domain-containing protein n=1 Tax=Urochloa decumbens TaxID=240449 RepID=A0ABC9EQN5_9POAL